MPQGARQAVVGHDRQPPAFRFRRGVGRHQTDRRGGGRRRLALEDQVQRIGRRLRRPAPAELARLLVGRRQKCGPAPDRRRPTAFTATRAPTREPRERARTGRAEAALERRRGRAETRPRRCQLELGRDRQRGSRRGQIPVGRTMDQRLAARPSAHHSRSNRIACTATGRPMPPKVAPCLAGQHGGAPPAASTVERAARQHDGIDQGQRHLRVRAGSRRANPGRRQNWPRSPPRCGRTRRPWLRSRPAIVSVTDLHTRHVGDAGSSRRELASVHVDRLSRDEAACGPTSKAHHRRNLVDGAEALQKESAG